MQPWSESRSKAETRILAETCTFEELEQYTNASHSIKHGIRAIVNLLQLTGEEEEKLEAATLAVDHIFVCAADRKVLEEIGKKLEYVVYLLCKNVDVCYTLFANYRGEKNGETIHNTIAGD